MACTTILVGKKATYDGSTMIARTEDLRYWAKKAVIVEAEAKPRTYTSVKSHLTIELPGDALRCSMCPNAFSGEGVWGGSGINAANVGMTATETITSNARVLGADPLVEYHKAEKEGEEDISGGIGEEDMVSIVLPYVRTAREGVKRLGSLLEKYGTYEKNGIAFNDADEVWLLETIGGHHWMARRIRDDAVAILPNQLGIDYFDFEDAFGGQEYFMCSADLMDFIEENHLNLNKDGQMNPRYVFGSRREKDLVYNTPRAWFMIRYFLRHTFPWDGPEATFTPQSDNIPFSFVPEKKVTVEDIKFLLSSHYQGTPYDPYDPAGSAEGRKYRPISVSWCAHFAVMQIRGYMPEPVRGIQWVGFGPTITGAAVPFYANVPSLPNYLSDVSEEVSTENFCGQSHLLAALADPYHNELSDEVDKYQEAVLSEGHRVLCEYDRKMQETGDWALAVCANEKICSACRRMTSEVLSKALLAASKHMKNNFAQKKD